MASGRVDYKRGRYQARALQSFQQLVALYHNTCWLKAMWGMLHVAKQYDDAVLAFERGLQIKSD